MLGKSAHQVVVVGGGFGGLYVAKALARAPVQVTLVDKRNFHLFQPLLYQVATGGLSPGHIASPLRAILKHHHNTRVLKAEVTDILPNQRKLLLRDGELTYDTLILATGSSHHYFGHENWADIAPGLKTIEDALEIRRRIFLAFEAAEREPNPEKQRAWMTFVVVGGGPTGVELAGALGELAHGTLKDNFRRIRPEQAKILLLEGMERILPTYPAGLSAEAEKALARLGVTILTRTLVTEIQNNVVTMKRAEKTEQVMARTILWAAGMKASSLGQRLAERASAALDKAGRVIVQPDLTVPGYPNIFVIGDLAHFAHQGGKPLPGVAPVAMQQGAYVAHVIQARLQGQKWPPFHYRDKGSLAVIGRNAAVADFGKIHVRGFPAWITWLFIHIVYLIGFDNKVLVLFQWAWNYLTRGRGARLITGHDPFPLIEPYQSDA